MYLGVFDLFKIGIGPSSSHTMGPMVAAKAFMEAISQSDKLKQTKHIQVILYNSLAFTGKGHATDIALEMGLLGYAPDTIKSDEIPQLSEKLRQEKYIHLRDQSAQIYKISFNPPDDIIFDYETDRPHHPNGMLFQAKDKDDEIIFEEIYYSIGGGFIKTEGEMLAKEQDGYSDDKKDDVSYPFKKADELMALGKKHGLTIGQMMRANELQSQNEEDYIKRIDRIIDTMLDCIERGLNKHGTLPGGLKVKRRAADVKKEVEARALKNLTYPHEIMDYLSLYAMAVNEENADCGQVVTAPTNGAAGVIPAVLKYYCEFCPHEADVTREQMRLFLLTAGAIGSVIKQNASISGAEVGCQGEVGSASAMAAAGLTAVLGGTNEQIENAAEIALEHHLGMTCDPIGGLVQVPCIERNAMGAVKAVNAASLSLKGDGTHFVSLDACVITMRETGKDMLSQYKETSQGGLAVNVVEC